MDSLLRLIGNGLSSLIMSGQLGWLLDLVAKLQYLWRHEGQMYEILEYESTLELLDTKGENAHFFKRQKVKFLQNNIIAFEDYAWGDGNVLDEYRCSPGVVVDRYREGDHWNVLISLRETKSKGDIVDFLIERTEQNCFKKTEEWQQIEIRRYTAQLRMNVIFPKKRTCRMATIQLRNRNKVVKLNVENFQQLPDGRQLLRWETQNIYPLEMVTLRWQW